MNLGWLQDKRMRFVAKALPPLLSFVIVLAGLANQFGYWAIAIGLVGALFLWGVANRLVERASPERIASSVPKPSTTTTLHSLCDVGPYKVEAGEVRSILLDAKQGQRVKGHLEEVDGQPFDWYLADEKNMILLKNGEYRKFKPIEDHRGSRAYRVSRKIPWQGRWYLILDMIGKQYSRKVRVDFEPVTEND